MGQTVKSQTDNSDKVALIFGLGYTAKALLPWLQKNYRVIGTARSFDKAKALSDRLGIETLSFSGTITPKLKEALSKAHIIISTIPPSDDGTDPVISVLPNISNIAQNCQWAGYLSATSVYGDRQGKWAFEDEYLRPTTQRGRNRIHAELAWLESGLPVHIFRLAGIYGPQIDGQSRNAFQRIRMGRVKSVIKPNHVVNRIHVDDIASCLEASVLRPDPCQIYNVADGNPCPPQDVLEFAADLLSEPRPERVDLATANISPMARSFYSETKRIDISRTLSKLNWRPNYQNYREGLCEIYRLEAFGPDVFLLAGHVIVPDKDWDDVMIELTNHRDATRAEKGCLRFDVYPDLTEKGKLHVFEVFQSEKAFQLHKKRMAGTAWVKATSNIERFYTVRKQEAVQDSLPMISAKVVRGGSKHFRDGAKVYVIDGFAGESARVTVIGHHRHGGKIFKLIMNMKKLTDIKADVCYSPTMIKISEEHYAEHRELSAREELTDANVERLAQKFNVWKSAQ